jgi:hypothetical protein
MSKSDEIEFIQHIYKEIPELSNQIELILKEHNKIE